MRIDNSPCKTESLHPAHACELIIVINSHACTGYKLPVLHGGLLWQGDQFWQPKAEPPDIIAICIVNSLCINSLIVVFEWSFAAYMAIYVAAYTHACAWCKLSVLHWNYFGKETNFGCQNRSPVCQNRSGGTDFGSQNWSGGPVFLPKSIPLDRFWGEGFWRAVHLRVAN